MSDIPSVGRAAPMKQPQKGVAYSSAVRAQAISLWKSGKSSNAISEMVGVDSSVIRRWLRRYREFGPRSFQPYWRSDGMQMSRMAAHAEKDDLFQRAYEAYATSLDPVSVIARRYGLDYHAFKYHVERHHPELVEQRNEMKKHKERSRHGIHEFVSRV